MIRTLNLEAGMPNTKTARLRLTEGLRTARLAGYKAVKLIHGYGSSGRGGAIRRMTLEELSRMKKRGQIRAYASGEDFSPFSEDGRKIALAIPQAAQDRDYSRGNDGITVVLL